MGLPKTPEGIEAFKKKISILKKGTKHTEATKAKMKASQQARFEKNPDEERKKCREGALKQWQDQDRRKAMSERMKKRYEDPNERMKTAELLRGRPVSKETREKLRTFHKIRFQDPEVWRQSSECKMGSKNPMFGNYTKRKKLLAFTGKQYTVEMMMKISEALSGKQIQRTTGKRPAWVGQRISEAKKGKPLSEEHKRKLSAARIGRFKGPESNNWNGGKSFEPYCPKFNREFKFRVRNFFNNKCVVCGKTREENGQELDVHHINYDKNTCCNNEKPLFAALCITCHRKTLFNKEYWKDVLENIIMLEYDGECYLPKSE